MSSRKVRRVEERFSVSAEGMKELHKGRTPESLVKELIQNAWDEETTICRVIVGHRSRNRVLVLVEDDAAGFANIDDAYTLMGETSKRADPEKRGRFNLGEKEVLSVAVYAMVQTVGWTVDFPPEGGREVSRNDRKRGTVVEAMMPWTKADAERLVERLMLFRPPEGCRYTVNDIEVKRREALNVHTATLPTLIQGAPGEPMRPTRRKTELHITGVADPEGKGWIYEMGIPIQPIEAPYDVDVMQKVPMPPNRDTVSETYLQDIYAEVLNSMHQEMTGDEFAETWVRTAVEDNRVSGNAAKSTLTRRYGENVVMWSSDTAANIEAIDSGFQVLHPKTMSRAEREHLRERGGLQSSKDRFGIPAQTAQQAEILDISGDATKLVFVEWVKQLGRYAGVAVSPVFVNLPAARNATMCSTSADNPLMVFNAAVLSDDFLAGRGAEQMALVVHELGHAHTTGEIMHGPRWGDGCVRAGSMIAAALASRMVSADNPIQH